MFWKEYFKLAEEIQEQKGFWLTVWVMSNPFIVICLYYAWKQESLC
jgi:hypothetical protein